MPELILHHYDYSPFAEKIRLVFGFKRLAWRSVAQPAVMPKPDLVTLTGGYRHIPVLQVGADVWCDTRCIARELDRRHPSPPLVEPAQRGLSTAIEAWAESDLFWPAVRYSSGTNAETVDPRLHADRAKMRGLREPSIDRVKAMARRSLAMLRPQLRIVEALLAPGRNFLLSDKPSQADLAVYHALWFLSALEIDVAQELEPFELTCDWMGRVAAIGHGQPSELSPAQALEIARGATPEPAGESIVDDSLPAVGNRVAVSPDNYVTDPVTGTLVQVGEFDVAVRRDDPQLGEIVVHFPRIGYTIKELA